MGRIKADAQIMGWLTVAYPQGVRKMEKDRAKNSVLATLGVM